MTTWEKVLDSTMCRFCRAIEDFPDDLMDLVERRPVSTFMLQAAILAVVVVGIVTGHHDSANVPGWCDPAFLVLGALLVAAVSWQGVVRRRAEPEAVEDD